MLLSDALSYAYRVAAARFGGPIAMIRDDRQMVAVSGGMTQPVLRVYTAAGTLLSAFVWDKGPIVAMDWTDSEDLMVVQPDGQVGDCTAWGYLPGGECRNRCSWGHRCCPSTADVRAHSMPGMHAGDRTRRMAYLPGLSRLSQPVEYLHCLAGPAAVSGQYMLTTGIWSLHPPWSSAGAVVEHLSHAVSPYTACRCTSSACTAATCPSAS